MAEHGSLIDLPLHDVGEVQEGRHEVGDYQSADRIQRGGQRVGQVRA